MDYSQYPAENQALRAKHFTEKGMEMVMTENLVDLVWGDDRPARPVNPVKSLDIQFTGMSSLDKQLKVKEKCKEKNFDVLLVTTLDDICWITNCRGTDIDYNPVFFSYVLFRPGTEEEKPQTTLYVQPSKVEAIQEYLAS